MKTYSFILLISLVLNNTAYSQDKQVFERVTTKDGLSQSTVNYIIQDRKGFMWFATYGGLNRYDGYTFKVYSNIPGNKNSLSNNGITFLFEDRDGYIWIVNGFNAGLDKLDPVTDSFTNYKNAPHDSASISSNEVYSVMQDKLGNIWVCTKNALNLLVTEKRDGKTRTSFRRFYNTFTNAIFYRAYEDRNGNLLLFSDYLYYLNRKTNKIEKGIPLPGYAYGKLSIREDKSGNLWLGNLTNGLLKLVYNRQNQCYESVKSDILNVTTNDIVIDYQERIWVSTENKGLFLYDTKEKRLQNFLNDKTDETSISDNNVISLYVDRSGVLWIGTYTQGLCKCNLYKKEFYHFKSIPGNKNSLSGNAISSIHSIVPGELWVGIDLGGGINRFVFNNERVESVKHYLHDPANRNSIADNRIISLVQRKNGEVWAGSAEGYVIKIIPEKPGTNNHPVIKNYSIISWTFCMFEDRQGILWGGTWDGGLWRFNDKTESFTFFKNEPDNPSSLCENIIWAIYEDNAGNIWIGGHGKGISILPAKEKNKISPQFVNLRSNEKKTNGLSNNNINSFCQDHTGTMWIGTNIGLNKVIIKDNNFMDLHSDTQVKFFAYHMKNGLPNESIWGVLEDNNGNLWLSTLSGLSKFNTREGSFSNYNENDGLQSNEFTHNAYFKDQNGRMYFGGFNGFSAFYPDNIKPNSCVPEVVFTELKLFNSPVKTGEKINGDIIISESIDNVSEIVLSHKNKVLSLEFAALQCAISRKNQYAFKLEGFEKKWNYVGNKREATYTNLAPGEYTFKVKACNSDGIWNDKYTSLFIRILPPWWWTWWAKIFYFVLVALTLYFFRKYILIYANVKHQLKLEQIEKLRADEMNKMKIQFFTNISHELRTPLSLILSPLENLVNSTTEKADAKNQLALIYRNAEKLYRLVNDLMDFTKIEDSNLNIKVQEGDIVQFTREIFEYFHEMALKQDVEYQMEAKVSELNAWFDREKFEKIILNLLSNAFKFTSSKGKIVISIEIWVPEQRNEYASKIIEGIEYACISVIDNGRGIAPEYIDKIFDRFYQVPDNEYSNLTGTGIGLALTKNLVELHHGFITVKSEPKKETVFTVFLPLGNGHFNSSEIVEKLAGNDINVVIKPTNGSNYVDNDLQVIQKGKPKIIVVEDNVELREYLVSRLKNNYSVISTDNGRSGYEKTVRFIPDLIVSDILMPEVSGIEMCKRIRDNIAICHIPVVLLTAKASIDDKIEGIDTGADAYVTKPFDLRFLESVIRNLIDSRRKLYKRFSHDIYAIPKEVTTNPLDQELLEKAINYVHNNITNTDLSADDLAGFLSMSQRNAYRKIKALTNQSLNDFIRIIRLKMAIKLMDERKLTISEIAFNVGFASHAYFTRCFREQFGKSPSEYLSGNVETEDINNHI
jgi:signal transduction histidine kinase/ligand-binding sensor domain-containing protein/DNA-binding response OmpR family regulator